MFRSLIDFVKFLESKKQLVRISEPVRAELELTEIADRVVKNQGPALLFENVIQKDGQKSKFPVLMNMYGSWQRMAWALGVDNVEEIARQIEELLKTQPPSTFLDKLKKLPELIQLASFLPKEVSRGSCQEVVINPPDLSCLPIPKCWPQDGGPYITLGNVITRDPESGVRNVGLYRIQVLGKDKVAMHWQIHKVGSKHYQKYKEIKKPIDVAIFLGGDPVLTYTGSAPLPDAMDEILFAGFLRKKGVEMVKCKTVNLEVPADADFVIEGTIDPTEPLVKEGPFGDHTGYYSLADDYPLLRVTAITHRKEAIFPSTIVGPPPMEDAFIGKATERIFLPLIRTTFPEIVDMHLPVEGAFHNLAIVAIKKQYPGHARKIMHSLWGTGQLMFTKCAIVVDHDVDVQNLKEVTWHLLANLDPKRDILFSEGTTDALDHASPTFAYGSKIGIDGTRKWKDEPGCREWPDVIQMNLEVKQRIDSIWSKLGLK
ncbi:MAG: menaquinone biosynthesis decarboxylase [Deltaproteobacteria bacterium]|nr:menaquinone biosynthesis decarboxylase [Deltaproteobacteria bacterium]